MTKDESKFRVVSNPTRFVSTLITQTITELLIVQLIVIVFVIDVYTTIDPVHHPVLYYLSCVLTTFIFRFTEDMFTCQFLKYKVVSRYFYCCDNYVLLVKSLPVSDHKT